MKVTNSGNKEAIDLANVAKNRKANRADAEKTHADSAGANAAAGTASVELSGEAKAMAKANSIAKSEDVDQAKIDRIKALIAERKYNPDFGKVADKVVNETLLQDLS